MFFFLSKILSFLLSPFVWVFILFIWSFITRIETRARRLRITAFVLLYVISNSFIVDECFRQWEPVSPDHDKLPQVYQGAIVLGGIGDIDLRQEKIKFGYSSDRLFQAIPLFYSGKIGHLIFTGGSGSIEFPQKREGIFVGKYLRSINFPDSALIIESASRNTFENAVFTKRILDSMELKGPFLLVTSAFHMPRALAVFKKAGYENIVPCVTSKSAGVRRFTPDHLLMPDPGAAIGLQILIHEWVGFITYKIKGYA